MDSGAWALGLLLLPWICLAIVIIFLIAIFIIFIAKKNKKNEPNNIAVDYEAPKENKIKPKERTILYKIFIVSSILIVIFLFPFVNMMTYYFPEPPPEPSSSIESGISDTIGVFVWPIFIAYISMLVVMIKKGTNYRVVYYPVALLTFIILSFNLGVIYYGFMITWFFILLFYPIVILLIIASIIGYKLDNNTIKKKTVGIIILTILLIFIVIPFITSIISIRTTLNDSKENMYENDTIEPEQNNEYTKKQKEINQEFNTMLNSNFISVNDLKLSSDYTIVKSINLLISNDYMPNNEMDFCNALIESYENIEGLLNKYNYTSQTIHFYFTNTNPFAKPDAVFYQDGGYIRSNGQYWYEIYLNPSPISIKK